MTQPVTANRFTAFDRLRGLIMVLMAIDHASYFIARVHASESWADAPHASTITRWITHLCAPGFFMLMGAGMVWLGKARQKAGWTHAQIRSYFLKRGLVLLLIQQVVENPTWVLGDVSISPSLANLHPSPGGGSDFFLHLAVISALAAAMIFWSFLIELPSVVVLAISGAALGVSVWMTPPATEVATLFAPWLRVLFVPGHTNFINVLYPWVPWLAPAGLGIIVGRIVYKKPGKTIVLGGAMGVGLLVTWAALNFAGWGFFTKYPPSPAFLSLFLGVDGLLLAVLAATSSIVGLRPLEVFGRTPLFFYLLHLWVFSLLSFGFPNGTSLPVMYLVWAVAVVAMYPACVWYAGFKNAKPADSLWRLL